MKKQLFKVAIIVDSLLVQRSLSDIAFWIKQEKGLDLSLIIQNIPEKKIKRNNKFFQFLNKIINYSPKLFFWKIIHLIENHYLKKSNLRTIFDLVEINDCTKNKIFVNPIISKSGYVYRYTQKDLDLIKHNEFDLIIRGGSGILKGDVLSVSKLGIISFHHSDNRINRGGPAGFWEVYSCESKTGFIIQKLNEVLDGGHVLLRGFFPTKRFYLLNHANMLLRSNFYMKYLIKKISIDNKLPYAELNFPYSNKLYRFPDAKSSFLYIFKNLLYPIFKINFNQKILKKTDRWSVSYANKNWKELEMRKSHKILNPPNRFLADPFLYSKNGNHYCFLENYDYIAKKADISVYQINNGVDKFLGNALSEDFHLSFPYLFEVSGNLYMIPESHEIKQIRLYKCTEFPLKWKLEKVLIDNICAADTVVFYKDSLWWMLTNTDPLLSGDHQSDLSIFYSEDILTEDWKPHKLNPIYIDPHRSRNGGLFKEGDKFYRVCQKHGFCYYGESSDIYQIKFINKDFYKEELIGSIKPNFLDDIKGTHHFDNKNGYSVFDHVSLERRDI